MRDYSHIRRLVYEQPWAITPDALAVVVEVVERRLAGSDLSAEEKATRIAAAAPRRDLPAAAAPGSIALIPIAGVIAPRMGALDEISGGTSAEAISRDLAAAVRDPNIAGVILDVSSPGGAAAGIQELGDQIYAARAVKPIIAVAYPQAASAAYWLGSQASELISTPSGSVGSVGVILAHQDVSKAADQLGVKTTFITAGKYKAEGSPYGPLSEETRAFLQQQVDTIYAQMVRDIARGRGTSPTTVRDSFGQGRMMLAQEALQRGMIDKIGTLQSAIDGLIARQASRPPAGRSTASAAARREVAAARLRLTELEGPLVAPPAARRNDPPRTRQQALAELRNATRQPITTPRRR